MTAAAPALDLDTVAFRWERALDAGERALGAAVESLAGTELEHRRRALLEEREVTAELLSGLAAVEGIRPGPWLAPLPVHPQMLGLGAGVRACLFDLDDVLTDSGAIHAAAWAEAFDELLVRLAERGGWAPVPFDRDADYRSYVDGRPRLEGVHAFLASRGIRLPEGAPDDPAGAPTATGVARRKAETVTRTLHRRGVGALPGARRYLVAAGYAGVARAVVSASASTVPMLELAGLGGLVDEHVDAAVLAAGRLRPRPAPDVLLAACRRLGVAPADAVTFTHVPAGVAAGRAAGVAAVGVGEGARRGLLEAAGAPRVVAALASLLDPWLAERRR